MAAVGLVRTLAARALNDRFGSGVIRHVAMQQCTGRSDVIVSDTADCGNQSVAVLRRGFQRNTTASVRLVGAGFAELVNWCKFKSFRRAVALPLRSPLSTQYSGNAKQRKRVIGQAS
jgi:hypothetical protein